MRLVIAFALATTVTACIDDGSDHYASRLDTIIEGDTVTTRLQVSASTVIGGHGDHTSKPRTGLTILAGPVPGALAPLPEVRPGAYVIDFATPADAYAIELEGDHYEHAAAHLTAATATDDGAGGLVVTFAPASRPTVEGRTAIVVFAPDGSSFSCDLTLDTHTEDRIALDACLFARPGRYRLEVTRYAESIGAEAPDYLYAWAERRTTRVLFHDVP